MATPTLPSRGPRIGRSCYVTHVFWGVPTQGDKIRNGYITSASLGPKNGQNCFVTPAFSGVPKEREQSEKWLHHLRLLGGLRLGGVATSPLRSRVSPEKGTKSEVATSPLPSRGPKIGRSCYIKSRSPGCPNKGAKSEVATSAVPSRWPKSGRNCYVTQAFSGVPRKGDKIKRGYITFAFLGAQDWAELLRHPCVLGGPKRRPRNIYIQRWLRKTNGAKKDTKNYCGKRWWMAWTRENECDTYPKWQTTKKLHNKVAQNFHQAMQEYEKT